MWKCKKCGEKIEDEFDVCWSCGADKDGGVVDKELASQISSVKVSEKQDRIAERQSRIATRKVSETEVVIVDVQIPFWSMVVLMVKSAFAAIPAMFVVMLVIGVFFATLRGLFMR